MWSETRSRHLRSERSHCLRDDTRSLSLMKLIRESLDIGVPSIRTDTVCDRMTTGAQQALRRTMEIYSNTTRFALACNMSNKIIEPIQSRCAILRYAKLRDSEVLKRLLEICKLEDVSRLLSDNRGTALSGFASQVPYTDEGLSALIFTSEGDMRQAINNLQSTYSGFNFISPDNVFKVCDQPHPVIVKQMLSACQKGDVDLALDGLRGLWDQGYSAVDIVVTIFRVSKTMDE